MANEHDEDAPAENQDELDAVDIRDNGEPLVDFTTCEDLIFAAQHPVFDFPRVHIVRESVARMLCEAASTLRARHPHLKLQIVEGYRPIAVQRAMWKHALAEMRKYLGDVEQAILEREAGRFAAPPDAPTPPPHITGGAVDLEIIDEATGERIDFTSPFEVTDIGQAKMHARGLSPEAAANRALLRSILEPTGLTSYADEWWHWSYGDNGWTLRVGAAHAIYGPMEMPDDAEWVGDKSKLPREEQEEFDEENRD